MYDDETPEALEGIQTIFRNIDAAVNEHCPALEDQIGLLLTCILVRVAKMAQAEPINPKREIDKIAIALKKEWRSYQQLVDSQPRVN